MGGNRLSRGLTLEGLTTSYFVRNTTRQDSLYQMARWFGYRVGFEDLVRIFLPTDQILWFEGVYKLEMDLRKNFENNNEEEVNNKEEEVKNNKEEHYLNSRLILNKERFYTKLNDIIKTSIDVNENKLYLLFTLLKRYYLIKTSS